MAIGRHFREALLKATRSLELTDEGVGIVRGLEVEETRARGAAPRFRGPTVSR